MFLPIHDDNPRQHPPVVTLLVIVATVLVWLVVQDAGSGYGFAKSLCDLGMIPGELSGKAVGQTVPLDSSWACVVDPQPAWWTVVTSMFLHGDWFHLIGNLWFLWLFGDNVEDKLGHVGFLVFYLVCGLAAAATQFAVDPASPIPMIGASGAISGVMGAYVVWFPHVRVRVLAILVIFIFTFRLQAIWMLGYWFLLQLIGALPQLGGSGGGVAFWAHVGGFLIGAAIALGVRRATR